VGEGKVLSICAVIAGRSTKPRGFDNENENTENHFIRAYYLQYLHPKKSSLFARLNRLAESVNVFAI